MADLKISALPASTTPLAGTEIVPLVQSSTTKNVSVANLTAGRAVAMASATMSTGSLVPSTAGQGVNFTANTPADGMTSQLLSWYEEGAFTPVVTPGSGSITTQTGSGTYTRVGRIVTVNLSVTVTGIGTASGTYTVSLPIKAANPTSGRASTALVREDGLTGQSYQGWVIGNTTSLRVETLAGANVTWANNQQFTVTLTYFA